jgi:hypothetical protein
MSTVKTWTILQSSLKNQKQVPLDPHQAGTSLILSKVGNLASCGNYKFSGPSKLSEE